MPLISVFKFVNWITGAPTPIEDGVASAFTLPLQQSIIDAMNQAPFLASGVNHRAGFVPDPGAVAGTTKFLREDATWAVPTVPTPQGLLLAITYYIAAGSYTFTPQVGTRIIVVEIWGGGGSAGGAAATGASIAVPGSGGAGGYSNKVITTINASETVTIGAGAAAPAAGANNGGTGGTTSFGAHCSATGGTGGTGAPAAASSNPPGGQGGVGSGGNLNINGGDGQFGIGITAIPIAQPAPGGYAARGGTPGHVGGNGANGGAGNIPGGGGSGSYSFGGAGATAGGAGADGGAIVYEYS